jgi:hypothetical protein
MLARTIPPARADNPHHCVAPVSSHYSMNRDFIVFQVMRKNYPQVTDEQLECGILKAKDSEEEEDE